MRAETLRDLSPDELDAKSDELREQLLKLRFQQSTGQIESPQMLRAVRKDIARVMTVRREKELGSVDAPANAAEQTPTAEQTDTEDGTD
jgi:large subunit ribosomal protein L29